MEKEEISLWARAYICACEAHKKQVDRGGQPYMLHVMHVAQSFPGDEEATVVGLLHDVLEDSDMTAEDLLEEPWSIPPHLVEAVQALTHKQDGLSYMQYIRRVAQNPLARRVKIVDIKHNMDLSRLPHAPTERDLSRNERYAKALHILEGE